MRRFPLSAIFIILCKFNVLFVIEIFCKVHTNVQPFILFAGSHFKIFAHISTVAVTFQCARTRREIVLFPDLFCSHVLEPKGWLLDVFAGKIQMTCTYFPCSRFAMHNIWSDCQNKKILLFRWFFFFLTLF